LIDALAWPATALVLGFGFLLMFRKSIVSILDRTKKVGKGGLETFEAHQLPAPAEKPDPLAEFMGTFDNPLLREQEASIIADMKARGLADASAAQKALIRSLAGTQILLHFERVSASIWASQINLLTYLNSRPAGVPLDELRPFYDTAKQQTPEFYQNYPFEGWVAFLESFHLIERDQKTILLSKVGREFLKWRIEVGRAGPFFG
jgi:hypothetical protein